MFKWFINLFEKIKSIFRTDTSKMYEGEKPGKLVKKVMSDGWNRIGEVMFKWLRNRIELLKNDKQLALIMLLHIVLIGLHVYEWKVGDIEYHWYLRAGGCGVIALFIFLFGRK